MFAEGDSLGIWLEPHETNTALLGKEYSLEVSKYYPEFDDTSHHKDYRNYNLEEFYKECECRKEIVTDKVTKWEIDSPEKGSIIDGKFRAEAVGSVSFRAEYDGHISEPTSMFIKEKLVLIGIRVEPMNTIYLFPGEEIPIKVYGYYVKSDPTCDSAEMYEKYNSNVYDLDSIECIEKIDKTDEIKKWTVDSDITITKGKLKVSESAVSNEYHCITAQYSEYIDYLYVVVLPNIWFALRIKPADDNYALSNLNCSESRCYAIRKGFPARFRTFGSFTTFLVYGYDITRKATWEISDTSIATIKDGVVTPLKRGMVWIRTSVGDAKSGKVWISVLDDTPASFLIIKSNVYTNIDYPLSPLKVGSSYGLSAFLYRYEPVDCTGKLNCSPDLSYSDVTSAAMWSLTDDSKLDQSFSNGYNNVTGKSPGFVDVTATYDGMISNIFTLDVWDKQNLAYCDPDNINSGEWDNSNTKAVLETDCRFYSKGEDVKIRYTAKVNSDYSYWYYDNCLDLYILDENGNVVKTIREEGCSNEPLKKSLKRSFVDVYQTLETWDMTDNYGNKVPAGKYYATARFYILWDPVIQIPITIMDAEQN